MTNRLENDIDEQTVPTTTPPIAPTEPSPIPIPPREEEMQSDGSIRKEKDSNTITPQYYCPMRCEGDKTYSLPGNCPVCGMTLKQL